MYDDVFDCLKAYVAGNELVDDEKFEVSAFWKVVNSAIATFRPFPSNFV
jgi:hypothetical protein